MFRQFLRDTNNGPVVLVRFRSLSFSFSLPFAAFLCSLRTVLVASSYDKKDTGRDIVRKNRYGEMDRCFAENLEPCRIVISAALIIRRHQAGFRRLVFRTVTVPY